jgi:hypothetical protein
VCVVKRLKTPYLLKLNTMKSSKLGACSNIEDTRKPKISSVCKFNRVRSTVLHVWICRGSVGTSEHHLFAIALYLVAKNLPFSQVEDFQ